MREAGSCRPIRPFARFYCFAAQATFPSRRDEVHFGARSRKRREQLCDMRPESSDNVRGILPG